MANLVLGIELLSNAIALVGGVVIMIGVVVAAFRLTRIELSGMRNVDVEHDRQSLRHHFGYYILLGLEFLIAADIVRTLIHPSMEELISLGVIVFIRTVISVTLNWELSLAPAVKDDHP
jgi:uncharacterized membrane protein